MRACVGLLLLAVPLTAQAAQLEVHRPVIRCEGTFAGHLQGLDADADSIYWSFTTHLVRTDADGRRLAQVAVTDHHGDLCVVGDAVYCAVNFGLFNDAEQRADSWVYVYRSADLAFVRRHPVPELVYGAGGITWNGSTFLVVGGLPEGHDVNPVHEYDPGFGHVARHDVASGWTQLGIQTAAWDGGRYWFGCYGSPVVTLRADREVRFVDRTAADTAYGVAAVARDRFLLGRWDRGAKTGSAVVATRDENAGGFRPVPSAAFRLANGVTAHRGASFECPENTLQAFRRAFEIGADWIEIDVYLTADGEVVVTHDRTTGRVADQNLDVTGSTWAALRPLDVTAQFRDAHRLTLEQCPPEPMPRLEEVLALVKTQHRTRVSIQPKGDSTAAALAIVQRLEAAAWVGFNDMDLAKMRLVKRDAPAIPVFWDRPPDSEVTQDLATALARGFECLVIRHDGVDAAKVEAIHAAGLRVGAWTVNDPARWQRLRALGVDRIYTDDPRGMLR